MAESKKKRPVFFNLLKIQMPVGALTSIIHRITGIFLAIGIPFSIYLLDISLKDPQGYAQVIALFDKFAFRMIAITLIWALAYHLLAGIRHLLMDIDVGSHLHGARYSAWIVNLSGAVLVLFAVGVLL